MAATTRRRLLTSRRVAPLLAGLEGSEGVLRRRRVTTPTRGRYAAEAATQLIVAASIGMIIAFVDYGRASDGTSALRNVPRPPAPRVQGGLRHWTLTFFPETQSLASMTCTQDDTVTIGDGTPQRKLVCRLCLLFLRFPTSDGSQRAITRKQHQNMFYFATPRARMSLAGLLRLRHGGASADGLLKGMDRITDLDLATRGRWEPLDSVWRYRRPTKSIRQLALLTPTQMRTAQASQYSILSKLMVLVKGLSVKGFVC